MIRQQRGNEDTIEHYDIIGHYNSIIPNDFVIYDTTNDLVDTIGLILDLENAFTNEDSYQDITETYKLFLSLIYAFYDVGDIIRLLSYFLDNNSMTILINLVDDMASPLGHDMFLLWTMSKMIHEYQHKYILSTRIIRGINQKILKTIDKDEVNNMINHIKYKPGSTWFHKTKDNWDNL